MSICLSNGRLQVWRDDILKTKSVQFNITLNLGRIQKNNVNNTIHSGTVTDPVTAWWRVTDRQWQTAHGSDDKPTGSDFVQCRVFGDNVLKVKQADRDYQ